MDEYGNFNHGDKSPGLAITAKKSLVSPGM
jgi:hypothetical protein